jgi:hypothetical protein
MAKPIHLAGSNNVEMSPPIALRAGHTTSRPHATNYRGELACPLFPALDRQENEYRGPTKLQQRRAELRREEGP